MDYNKEAIDCDAEVEKTIDPDEVAEFDRAWDYCFCQKIGLVNSTGGVVQQKLTELIKKVSPSKAIELTLIVADCKEYWECQSKYCKM